MKLSFADERTEKLIPSARNARTHSKKQVNQIAQSIKNFGFVNPILIDEHHHIIAGHGRLSAAQGLGLEWVPTIQINGLSEHKKRALALADNKIAENAGWDIELLRDELLELFEIDCEFDLTVTGFETAEIDVMRQSTWTSDETDSLDACLPLDLTGDPVTAPGTLWQLGRHRFGCGDVCNPAPLAALMGDECAEAVFIDPPYNVPIAGHVSGLGQQRHREFAMASGEMSSAQYIAFLTGTFQTLVQHARPGALHYVCIDWRHLYEAQTAGRSVYTELKNLCVWNKTNGGMGSLYRSKHELVLVYKSGTAPHINNVELGAHGRYRTNVWDYAGVNTFKAERQQELAMHPTVKPVAMVADALCDCSRHGGIILDTFAGSGTTLIAAERTGRVARCLDIDPYYVDVAVRRWQTMTGLDATDIATGETFNRLAARKRHAANDLPLQENAHG